MLLVALTNVACLLSMCDPASAAAPPAIAAAKPEADGWVVHAVQSEFQAGTTEIHVLLPSRLDPPTKRSVLYVLPVEAGDGQRWGNPRQEVKRLGLHDKHGWICVYPTFSHLPWYADHPQDARIRQERYFLQVVVPFVERTYPARAAASGRLLVGFSKSGWGAFSLLLRHPQVFGKAAAWDAPLAMERPDRFGMGEIFATQENFERYQITRLLREQADRVRSGERLIHLGYGNFRDQHTAAERLLNELQISHIYRDGPQRPHAWGSGWLAEATALLCEGGHGAP
jgi:hypothetical protein